MDIEKVDQEGRVKERIVYKDYMLRYGIYTPRSASYCFHEVPWHWHKEFEFGYIRKGKILYKTSRREFLLEEGDGVFINSGVLHALFSACPVEEIRLQSQFFDRSFLAGTPGDVFDLRYITPVQEQKLFDAAPLYGNRPEHQEFLEKMKKGITLSLEGEIFYELRLRSLFSELWETIYDWAMDEKMNRGVYNSREDERIKEILAYIQKNYGEKITVKDMSEEAHISQRECYRLFQKGLDMSPVEYVMSYRLQKAQEQLLESDKSILDIALETGFGTSSYFGRIFRKSYGMTPKEYRKLYQRGEERNLRKGMFFT